MATIPKSSNVILGCAMVAFFATGLVITFQAPPIWWVLPAVPAAVAVALATLRLRRHRRMRTVMQGARL